MDQDRADSSARVAGADTGPLAPHGSSPNYGGQPTTYVAPEIPAEIRAQGAFSGNYVEGSPPVLPPPSPHGPPEPPQPMPAPPPAYPDRRQHRTPLLGPLLLISAGVVFLLNNLGVLPWSVWETLGRLWPLILIAIGIDLVIGRRNPFFSVVVVLAVLGAGAAFVYANGDLTRPGEVVSAPLDLRLSNAEWANVHIDLQAGNLTIGGMSGDDRLLATGRLEYFNNRGAPRQEVSESGKAADIEIVERSGGWALGLNWFNGGRSPNWEIDLNESVPVSLDVDGGTGNMTLDLEKLQLRELLVDMGTGNASITLPSNSGETTVELDGGTGNVEVIVPEDVEARIEVDSGIGTTTVDTRFSREGDDTYESPGYGTATNKVTIKIDHGIGNLNIQSR